MRSKGRCESASAVRPAAFHASGPIDRGSIGAKGSPRTSPLKKVLAYFKLNARRWQARVPRGCWMPLRWAQPPSYSEASSRWSACGQGKSRGVEFDILQGREKRCIVSRSKWRFFLFAIFSGAKPSPACVVAGKGTIEPLCSALDVLGESLMASSTIVSMLLSPPIVDHLV